VKGFLFVLALATWLVGCTGGTETGNPSFEATLTYTAYSSEPSAISVRESGAPVAKASNVRFLKQEANTTAFEIGSGHYRFQSKL